MIDKKRLEELIEQGATIYWIYGKSIEKKTLKHKYHSFFICDNELNEYNAKQYIGIWKHKLSKLFETREEAEWHRDFGCIERTERLVLPTWEEFNEMSSFIFENKDGINLEMAIWCCDREDLQIKTIKITNFNDWNIRLFEQPLTKENYILACRKAKELFLGENK